jgi:hypothetical protein
MKPERSLAVGDLVTLVNGDWNGLVGIVSQPITEDHPGHVLVHRDGCILGVPVSRQGVMVADGDNEGFAQLAYNLIQLGSHVIETRLIV